MSPETLELFALLLNGSKVNADAPDLPAEFDALARELFRRALAGLSLSTAAPDFEETALAIIQARRELDAP